MRLSGRGDDWFWGQSPGGGLNSGGGLGGGGTTVTDFTLYGVYKALLRGTAWTGCLVSPVLCSHFHPASGWGGGGGGGFRWCLQGSNRGSFLYVDLSGS